MKQINWSDICLYNLIRSCLNEAWCLPSTLISRFPTLFINMLYLRNKEDSMDKFACVKLKREVPWAYCMTSVFCSREWSLETISVLCVCVCAVFIQEKRRLAIRNAAQQWEGVRACLELPPANGAKEEVSPENSPAHSPAQTNGLAQEPSPEEPR